MKAKSLQLAILASLSTGVAHADPGIPGGVNSLLNEVPDQNFSTTTRLRGEVLFAGAFGDDGDSLGASSLFTERGRLGEDPNLDRSRLSLNASFSDYSNLQENLNDQDESTAYYLGARFLNGGSNGKFSYSYGLDVGATHYDYAVNRIGDDKWIADIGAAYAFRYDVNDSVSIDSISNFYYGGHADVGRGFTRNSIYDQNFLKYDCSTEFNYRLDGGKLGDQGVEWSSDFTWGGFEGDEQDALDNYSIGFRQELRNNLPNGNTVFGEIGVGTRIWDRMDQYDSDWYRVGGGFRGQFTENIQGEIKAGYEIREYDENGLHDDKQEEFYVEGAFFATLGKLLAGAYVNYGIQEFYGEGARGLDPIGIRTGIRAVYEYDDATRITSDWNYTTFENSDVVNNYDADHWIRWACGLGCEHDLSDQTSLGLGCSLIYLDDDFDDETDVVTTLRFRHDF